MAVAILSVCLVSTAAACTSPTRGGERALDTDLVRTIDEIVATHMAAGLIPGAEVAIVDPAKGTYIHAYGVADTATGRTAQVRDHFRIGSITKTFTAAAVLRLADAGRLRLTDTLEQYVPGVPNGTTITLADLLGMRGGVWKLDGDTDFGIQALAHTPDKAWNDGDTLRALIVHPERAKPPNQQTSYSNSEFYLLGLVLEKVTGKPVAAVLDSTAQDFGLRETSYTRDTTVPEPHLDGYSFDENTAVDVTDRVPPSLYGAAGSMVSTISDLAAYGPQLATGTLLKPETFQARTRFTQLDGGDIGYGLGIARMGQWLGHNGAVLGFTDQLGYLPDKHATVAVAINQFGPGTWQLLPVDAALLWFDLVDALYPGTGPVPVADPKAVEPPAPTAAELDQELSDTARTDPVAGTPTLRIAGDRNGDIRKAWANDNSIQPTRYQIHDVHRLRHGLLVATGVMSFGSHALPLEIPLVPEDGAWQIVPSWICQFFTAAADRPAACDASPTH
ncbi:serine hydrolase domain-containing protein [Nocardia sp. NPDC059239]|uniref:serine hydrolase domain-containing protein n=1 Tax=unclassified Nocardia TaxID=2637762 RepID=UPI0036CE7B32